MTSGTELSEAQIEEYRDAFKLFDADGDGTISVEVSLIAKNFQSNFVNLTANPFNFLVVFLIFEETRNIIGEKGRHFIHSNCRVPV